MNRNVLSRVNQHLLTSWIMANKDAISAGTFGDPAQIAASAGAALNLPLTKGNVVSILRDFSIKTPRTAARQASRALRSELQLLSSVLIDLHTAVGAVLPPRLLALNARLGDGLAATPEPTTSTRPAAPVAPVAGKATPIRR